MGDQSLRESLAEWTDWDFAAFAVAQSLGLMGPDVNSATEAKHVFWSSNPVGVALHNILGDLVSAGILENRGEPDDQCRWIPAFLGSWECPREAEGSGPE